MFKYIVKTIEENIEITYDFETDYIKAVMFLSQCKMNNIKAKIVSEYINN